MERTLANRDQRRSPLGERPVVGLVTAAEILVHATIGECVEPIDRVGQRLPRHADELGQLLQGGRTVPQSRPLVFLGFGHRHIGGLHRRHRASTIVVDHPERQCHRIIGEPLDHPAADPVVGGGFVDESLPVAIDEDTAGEPQCEGRAAVGMDQPRRPPCLIHQIGIGTGSHRRHMRPTLISPGPHGVAGLSGHAEAGAQLFVLLESAGRQQHTLAGTDRDPGAVLLHHGAGHPAVLGDQLDQRRVQMRGGIGVFVQTEQ